MTPISNWRDLPFREIWIVDTEFYPGPGFANGGVTGDPITPLCLVALEMRSGRLVRLWQDQLGPFPPYRLDNDALIVGYLLAAEFGFHAALGWGEPACALDAYVEFRHYVNDGSIKSGERERGFYSIGGALRYFLEDEIDVARKHDMRERILQGPPFDAQERRGILDYCEDDVRALARLLPHIAQTIRLPLAHAMFRAKFQWTIAQQERRGVPMDGALLARLRSRWQDIRLDLVTELDRPFGIYEIVNGRAHWRKQRFADYVRHHRMSWPTNANGTLDETDETFREMAGKYPHIEPLRELRYSLSKLRLNDLAVGHDQRNRAPLWAYGTKTGRSAPGASQFVFGPAKWLRFLITPPPGRALVHRDFSQQEVRIAAVLSGDSALLEACESGDVYLGIAQQLGFLPDSLSERERKAVRALFKTVVLGIQYGLGFRWPPAPAFRCSRPSRFRRACGRVSIGSRTTPRASATMLVCAWRSARRSVGSCNAHLTPTRARSAIFQCRAPAARSCTWPAFWRNVAELRSSPQFTTRSWPRAQLIRSRRCRPRSIG